jgi:glycosyltransferase involved in cell wall biosynthesis
MSHNPRISVLLPAYDTETFLPDCLRSLQRQTFADFEVIAVDDGSTDATPSILDSFAAADPRIRPIRHDHRGLIATLNSGLDECRGQFVARIDADDLAHPRRLELQIKAFLDNPELDVVSSLVSHFPRAAVGMGFRIYEQWLNSLIHHEEILRERFIESPIPHPSVLIRREVLESVDGYRDMQWPEDYDLWLRLAHCEKRFAKVPRVLCLWRQHESRLTKTDRRYSVEKFLACKAHHLAVGPLRSCRRVIIWGAGQTGRRLSKHLKRFGCQLAAFIDIDPKKIGSTLRGLPIHSPNELTQLLSPQQRNPQQRDVVLAAVSSRGARALIREQLDRALLRETVDYWCVA